jgi:hypothetical protein
MAIETDAARHICSVPASTAAYVFVCLYGYLRKNLLLLYEEYHTFSKSS